MFSNLAVALTVGALGVAAQTAVSDTVFNNINRYHSFAAASYADDCPTPPQGSSILKFFNDTTTDTQATLYRDAKANELILAFRGTSTPVDLDTDFLFTLVDLKVTGSSCSGCKVHQGFQNAYNTLASTIVSQINSAQSSNPGSTLVVTGHSLGGGLASIASSALVSQGKKVTTYTFGEPRNGNAAFTTYINNQVPNYFRVTHANDGVPQIPPALLGYQHHGKEYWQKNADGNTASTTFLCSGNEPTTCNNSQEPGSNPINKAHLFYSNSLTASSLFNAACGFKKPS